MSDTLAIESKLKKYSVHFVQNIADVISKHNEKGDFFLVDRNVVDSHKNVIIHSLPMNRAIIIEVNEKKKSLESCKNIIEELVEKNIRRDQSIVAIGGGIVQDIASFSASILYRGIDWLFIPTTLLAQADSCIGGKTSINLGNKKNLIGNFYPPSAIYINEVFLSTLTVKDLKSGIGEILHYYIYADSPKATVMMANYEKILEVPTLLAEHIRTSLSIKKDVIEIDEFDRGERNKFNYGHTFGHALESLTDYRIGHGQAVTMGMDIANYISLKLNIMEKETYTSLCKLLKKNIPVFNISDYSIEDYFLALKKDKKNIGDDLVCILARSPGNLVKKRMTIDDEFKEIILSYFDGKKTINK